MKKTLNLFKTKLLLTAVLFTNIALIAQTNQAISGTVTSKSDNSPIPGVSVMVEGTTNGTSTDFDGNYSIEAPQGSKIVFSFLGFASKSITVSEQSTVNVGLAEDSNELDEVVVVGYGSRKKSDITGSVSSVKSEELTAFPVQNAQQALQGRAAGVVVQSNNGGEPGAPISVQVRGNTSIGANSGPLVVVDGFIGASMPQADDIQSMEVLKDASATAIYGSRGSGGVILVTTKKGRAGDVIVEVNSTYSLQSNANQLDLMNADEFAAYQQSFQNYTQGEEETDWQDEIYQDGYILNTQASVSGGTDKVNFYASGNYFGQEGVIVNSDYEKITFLTNVDAQVNSKLKVGLNLFGSRSVKGGVSTQSTGSDDIGSVNGGGDDVVSLAMRFSPDSGIYDDQGNYTQSNVGDGIENPWAVANHIQRETKSDRFRANTYFSYDILENLNFRSSYGLSTRNETVGYFKPQTFQLSTGGASYTNRKSTTTLTESFLTYTKEISKGTLTAMAGFSYQKDVTERLGAGNQQLLSDKFLWYNLDAGQLQTRSVSSSYSKRELQSVFGRLNYDYDDKYLVTATVRRDGASNFAENEKYATFPSGAIGWKMSNEDFLKDVEMVSNLKLRASYGHTGNQAISAYQSLEQVALISPTVVGEPNNTVPQQSAEPDLKWETSKQTNIGVDFGMLNSTINLSVDYYNIDTEDLLLETQGTPGYIGEADLITYANVGAIKNEGFEISLNTRNIATEDFTWTTDFNISSNRNTVTQLNNGGADVFGNGAPAYFSGNLTYLLRVGESVGSFWGHEYAGVYNGELAEGSALKANGGLGDPMFKDINGDGQITDEDDLIIGDPNADYNWGFTNTFTYKNWDMNIFFQGSQGGEILNLTNVQLYNGDSNALVNAQNAWSVDNTSSNIPKAAIRDREISSRFVEDGSYARLKNLAIGYNFPATVTKALHLDMLRLTASGQNLLTFTKYSGLDPEVNYAGGGGADTESANVIQGHDFGNYPTVRSFSLSVNLKF